MKSFCIASVLLVLSLSGAGSGPSAAVEPDGTTAQNESAETAKETSGVATAATDSQEDAKLEKTVASQGESTQEGADKQDDAKPQKTTPAPPRLSSLLELAEGERAATKEEIAAEEELMAEISGLIIEQTMTKIGYDFYEYFFLFWEAPQDVGVKDYNIFISEMASPLWGSWVSVAVNEAIVWSKVLRPRSEEIEEAVKQAIEATGQYLYNYEQYQFQTEDMVGTGI